MILMTMGKLKRVSNLINHIFLPKASNARISNLWEIGYHLDKIKLGVVDEVQETLRPNFMSKLLI